MRILTSKLKKSEKNAVKQSVYSQVPAPYSPGCFIATVVYGSPNHHKLVCFREFKDDVLLMHKIGKMFVRLYYRISIKIANKIKKRKILRKFILFLLIEPIYRLIEFLLH